MWVCVYKFRKMDEFHVWANMIPTWGPGDYENLREELDFPQSWNGDSHAFQGLQAREIPAAISSVPGWSNDHLMEPCCCKSAPVCSRHFFAQPGLILLVFAKTNGQVSKWSHVSWMPCTLYLQVEIRLVPWNTSAILRMACLQLVSLGFLDHSSAFFLATQCIMWKWSGRPVLCRELAAPNVLWIISVPRLAPRSNPPTPHTPSSL